MPHLQEDGRGRPDLGAFADRGYELLREPTRVVEALPISGLTVVFLTRKAEGIAPVSRFVESCRARDAGVAHELVVVFKGYQDDRDFAGVRAVLERVAYRPILMGDEGFDIGAYLSAAREVDRGGMCFLNTFSEILASNWLRILIEHCSRPGVGLAGAMGSYESLTDWLAFIGKAVWLCEIAGIPYDSTITRYFRWVLELHAPKWMARKPHGIGRLHGLIGPKGYGAELDAKYVEYWDHVTGPDGPLREFRNFPRFPHPHVRSNCFMIERSLLLRLASFPGSGKNDSYAFESGREGLTAQMRRLGLSTLVVGRDDRGFDVPEWSESGTFRLGAQDNLVVSDNQVRSFVRMTREQRATHVYISWGDYIGGPPSSFPDLNYRFPIGDLAPVPASTDAVLSAQHDRGRGLAQGQA